MRQKTIGQRLDDLSRASGLYGLTLIEQPKPRNLRWLPVLVLAMITIGYVALETTVSRHGPSAPLIAGSLSLFGGFIAANFIRFFGPRLIPAQSGGLDEREKMVKARAGNISGGVITVAAIAGCFWFGLADGLGLWRPPATMDWIYLAVALEGWAFALPVLVASWLQPADSENEG